MNEIRIIFIMSFLWVGLYGAHADNSNESPSNVVNVNIQDDQGYNGGDNGQGYDGFGASVIPVVGAGGWGYGGGWGGSGTVNNTTNNTYNHAHRGANKSYQRPKGSHGRSSAYRGRGGKGGARRSGGGHHGGGHGRHR